ncbi:MAG: PleD family two-component system response regulator [Burkholderiales bacterium]|jgi:twitching motility two-component system response regulator PilH
MSSGLNPAPAEGNPGVGEGAARPRSGVILVVDDSATERHHLVDLLKRQGFEVRSAEDGLQAIARIRMQRPALIIMDVVMPGANGFQVTRALARDPETRDIPVILCTTKDAETDRIWGLRQGAKAYVTKPVDSQTLLARIAELLP